MSGKDRHLRLRDYMHLDIYTYIQTRLTNTTDTKKKRNMDHISMYKHIRVNLE